MKKYTSAKTIPYEYTLVIPENTLKFDSKFEGGNLRKAIRLNECEYNLLLEYDTETEGYTQWFYFSVDNYEAGLTVRFNIINLMKFDSLYNNGMKPLVMSTKEGMGWQRAGYNVSYYQNNIQRPTSSPKKPRFYFTLTFCYTFEYEDDKAFFAYCYPYTFTQLLIYLGHFKSYEKILRIEPLCRTLADNACPVLTITNNAFTYPVLFDNQSLKRKESLHKPKHSFKEKLRLNCKSYI